MSPDPHLWEALQTRWETFVTAHSLSYLDTLYYIDTELYGIERLGMQEVKRFPNDQERRCAAILITSKIVFNADIQNSFDIAEFLNKIYSGHQH